MLNVVLVHPVGALYWWCPTCHLPLCQRHKLRHRHKYRTYYACLCCYPKHISIGAEDKTRQDKTKQDELSRIKKYSLYCLSFVHQNYFNQTETSWMQSRLKSKETPPTTITTTTTPQTPPTRRYPQRKGVRELHLKNFFFSISFSTKQYSMVLKYLTLSVELLTNNLSSFFLFIFQFCVSFFFFLFWVSTIKSTLCVVKLYVPERDGSLTIMVLLLLFWFSFFFGFLTRYYKLEENTIEQQQIVYSTRSQLVFMVQYAVALSLLICFDDDRRSNWKKVCLSVPPSHSPSPSVYFSFSLSPLD